METVEKAKFSLGRVVTTPGALSAFEAAQERALGYLMRHASGDWGELCKDDQEENRLSLKEGFRLLSAYTLRSGIKIWIITEGNRSVTTILLPDEY